MLQKGMTLILILVILPQRQVQIISILVTAVGYNITNITCSVFLRMFFQFLHFQSAAPQFYFYCYKLIVQFSVSFGQSHNQSTLTLQGVELLIALHSVRV